LFLINHLNLLYLHGVFLSSVSILQFNNSELRDLYVHGLVDCWILACVYRPDVAVCHTYH